jgi:formylglycine-generating enzyme required for sulfatase activity
MLLGLLAGLAAAPACAQAQAQPIYGAGSVLRDCADCPEVVVLPKGNFTMGAAADEVGRKPTEQPAHAVAISNLIGIGRFEIRRGEFARFARESGYVTEAEAGDGCWVWRSGELSKITGTNWLKPGFEQTDAHPAVCVSWNDAQAYVKWLSQKTGKTYRLPSEAEWEFAARARSAQRYSFGMDESRLTEYGWFVLNSGGHTHSAGERKANAFGLYDMHGNVWEWTQDCWHESFVNAPADGSAWVDAASCSRRVFRGGSWGEKALSNRSAARAGSAIDNRSNFVGFRIVRVMP